MTDTDFKKKRELCTWKRNTKYLRTISRFIPFSFSYQAARRKKDSILES